MNDFETGIVVVGLIILIWHVHAIRKAVGPQAPDRYWVQIDFEVNDDEGFDYEFLQKSLSFVITPRVGDTVNIGYGRSAYVHRVVYGENEWPSVILKHHPLTKQACEELLREMRDDGWT